MKKLTMALVAAWAIVLLAAMFAPNSAEAGWRWGWGRPGVTVYAGPRWGYSYYGYPSYAYGYYPYAYYPYWRGGPYWRRHYWRY
jgi:hypothetical protein